MNETAEKPETGILGNILLVDDTPANLKVLTELLKEYNYKVRAVPSGKLALKSVAHSQPDLILLDINMPEMNGYEVCQQLKDNPETAAIPVIFISALDDVQDKIQAFRQGGVDYITKPFQIEEVHARIKTHLTIDTLQRELQEKNLRLESQLGQLQEMQSMQDTLLNMVVHDLRVPLTGAIGYVSLVAENASAVPAPFANYIQQAHKSLDSVKIALENIVDLGKMERGKISLTYAKLELVSCLRDWLDEIELIAAQHQFEAHLPPAPIEIMADPLLLKRIVFNLLTNAFRLTELGKRVQLNLKVENEWFYLAILDQGPGIPEEYREKIFEKFVQVQLSHRSDPASSGLGLTFCKMAVEAHRGQIGVESEVGKGSTFWFRIPLKAPKPPLGTSLPSESS
jgi:two-component system sensor histidine kinase/response regulator